MITAPAYTVDWFSTLIPSWTDMLTPLHGVAEPQILEVGAFEGRATCWMLEHFPKSIVTVVDPFMDILGYAPSEISQIEARFLRNVEPFGTRCALVREPSCQVLPWLVGRQKVFDFIYIDGSHWAHDVIFDAVCGYRLLKFNGLMCFDDFIWDEPSVPAEQRPQPAITSFLASHVGRVELLCPIHRQVWVKRTA